jgi:Permuted papain-like amidase enzyme, YaeF/YiiX, C92 family
MNRRAPFLCIALLLLSTALCSAEATPSPTPRTSLSSNKWESKLEPGDIVFIRSRSINAPLIAALSNEDAESDADNVFTHCGIIFKDSDAKLRVYEGEGRGPINWLTLADWQATVSKGKVGKVERSDLHNVYAMRWNGAPKLATGLVRILEKAKELHATDYDHGFSWTDTRAYCSELVWKAYLAGGLSLGTLPTMEKYVKGAPKYADKIKGKLEEAKANKLRDTGYLPNESAISPEDIYKSPNLTPITD